MISSYLLLEPLYYNNDGSLEDKRSAASRNRIEKNKRFPRDKNKLQENWRSV